MDPIAFFTAFAVALKLNPPHAADAPMVRELERIGIVPGQDFDASKVERRPTPSHSGRGPARPPVLKD